MNAKRALAVEESLALVAVTAGDLLSQADPTLPSPRRITGTLAFFAALGLASDLGDGPARFAAAAGGVAVLTAIVIGPAGVSLEKLLTSLTSIAGVAPVSSSSGG